VIPGNTSSPESVETTRSPFLPEEAGPLAVMRPQRTCGAAAPADTVSTCAPGGLLGSNRIIVPLIRSQAYSIIALALLDELSGPITSVYSAPGFEYRVCAAPAFDNPFGVLIFRIFPSVVDTTT